MGCFEMAYKNKCYILLKDYSHWTQGDIIIAFINRYNYKPVTNALPS